MNEKNHPKTLVIHPDDPSTDFLLVIYENLPNVTVITGRRSKEQVLDLIRRHDRVLMMGHGSPSGLFSVGQFSGPVGYAGYIIDDEAVSLLRQKKDCVFIWCHASDFVAKHGLTGFASGMFISEVGEAFACGVEADQNMVDEQNFLFVDVVARFVGEGTETLYRHLKEGSYAKMAERNPVAAYNHKLLAAF